MAHNHQVPPVLGDYLFWLLWVPGTYMVRKHTCMHESKNNTHIKPNFKGEREKEKHPSTAYVNIITEQLHKMCLVSPEQQEPASISQAPQGEEHSWVRVRRLKPAGPREELTQVQNKSVCQMPIRVDKDLELHEHSVSFEGTQKGCWCSELDHRALA